MLQDIGLCKDFLDKTTEAQTMKAKIGIRQVGLHQVIKLLHSSEVKRQPTDWNKIFANYSSDKGLIQKYVRSSRNSTKTKNPVNEWTKEGTGIFPRMKYRWSTDILKTVGSLAIRKRQLKITLRMSVIQNSKSNPFQQGSEEKCTLKHSW